MRHRIHVLTLTAAIVAMTITVTCQRPAPEFAVAKPGYQYSFPRDHAAHPAFQTEWWYYTGHLADASGNAYGFQLTLFRHALKPLDERESPDDGSQGQVLFGHAAVTDESKGTFRYREVISRGSSVDNAGARSDIYRTWIDEWVVEGLGRFHHIQAIADSLSINLVFEPRKPPVVHGVNGVSRKGEGASNASHYYSITRAAVEGVIMDEQGPTEVTGEAWLDREWSTSVLSPGQVGWDWFSVQLETGEELMLYRMRRSDGTQDPHSSGSWVNTGGASAHLDPAQFTITSTRTWKSPSSGAVYPAEWTIEVPSQRLSLRLRPTVADQELRTEESSRITYWEGSVRVDGTQRDQRVRGRGYVELTGYAAPLQMSTSR
ncbi:MAG: carotenoid 1,2-hydratase [Bacteroidetes bacterium]|jgi:predicted secreted hydrolase|nr:carotenoid 1,2-hydratase [Bacteroidota bacterium]